MTRISHFTEKKGTDEKVIFSEESAETDDICPLGFELTSTILIDEDMPDGFPLNHYLNRE